MYAMKTLLALCLVLALVACGEDTDYQGDSTQGDAGATDMGGQEDMASEEDGNNQGGEDLTEPPADIPVIEPEDAGFEPSCSFEDELAPNQDPDQAASVDGFLNREDLYVCPDTSDWYALEATQGQELIIFAQFDPNTADLDMYLYREGQRTRQQAVATSETPNQQAFLRVQPPATGRYSGH